MKIRIRGFGILQDVLGTSELPLEVQDGTQAADAVRQLADSHPGLQPHLTKISFAVNNEIAGGSAVLSENDELLLLPPVSGG